MKQLVVLSGKGGTGKTSVTAGLADVAARTRRLVLVDADADAANLALLLDPVSGDVVPFFGSDRAVVAANCCAGCGLCVDVCRSDAIRLGQVASIDPIACEGCGACVLECPDNAIRMVRSRAGSEHHDTTRCGPLFHGDLLPGQENSGKLVAALRRAGAAHGNADGADLLIVDGPPGIGCPVLAACTGTDLAVVVTEPGVSALHDLGRILDTLAHFHIPALAVLNKADLHAGLARQIRARLDERAVPLIGELPYDARFHEAVETGRPVTALGVPGIDRSFAALWAAVETALAA